MGAVRQRRQPTHEPHKDQDKPALQVDANRIIQKLQQQRAELSAQLDLVGTALEESQEREQQMLVRIAELEDKLGGEK